MHRDSIPEIPFGYCHCGCGHQTRISPETDPRRNWIKGQPRRFCAGHNGRLPIPALIPFDDHLLVPLCGKKHRGLFASIDADDGPVVAPYRWYYKQDKYTFYAHAWMPVDGGKHSYVLLHRLILSAPLGVLVDHVDGNGLHNWRTNIRLCDEKQNQANRINGKVGSSWFRGVTWHASMGKWQAAITHAGRSHYLGLFEDELSAAQAYDEKARELFGEFARLNSSAQ